MLNGADRIEKPLPYWIIAKYINDAQSFYRYIISVGSLP
jgi:hypothetical protein